MMVVNIMGSSHACRAPKDMQECQQEPTQRRHEYYIMQVETTSFTGRIWSHCSIFQFDLSLFFIVNGLSCSSLYEKKTYWWKVNDWSRSWMTWNFTRMTYQDLRAWSYKRGFILFCLFAYHRHHISHMSHNCKRSLVEGSVVAFRGWYWMQQNEASGFQLVADKDQHTLES